ncbi:MAG: glycogen-binding domain-containing protein [Verrucomicrobiota bacterium]
MSAKQTNLTRGPDTGNNANKTQIVELSPQPVHFEYINDVARKVCLAGSFNDWRPEGTELIPQGGGKWAKDLMLTPGSYEYRLVVDGQWLADPNARESVPNPFGGQNSVKIVSPPVPRNAPLLLAASRNTRRAAPARR